MRVIPVPVLSDNYAYLLVDSDGMTAAVDPVEPEKVLSAAAREDLVVSTILTTHHHWYASQFSVSHQVFVIYTLTEISLRTRDHAGGNVEFARTVPGIGLLV